MRAIGIERNLKARSKGNATNNQKLIRQIGSDGKSSFVWLCGLLRFRASIHLSILRHLSTHQVLVPTNVFIRICAYIIRLYTYKENGNITYAIPKLSSIDSLLKQIITVLTMIITMRRVTSVLTSLFSLFIFFFFFIPFPIWSLLNDQWMFPLFDCLHNDNAGKYA